MERSGEEEAGRHSTEEHRANFHHIQLCQCIWLAVLLLYHSWISLEWRLPNALYVEPICALAFFVMCINEFLAGFKYIFTCDLSDNLNCGVQR